jgi:protein-L-isoaspartate(D-aspartate) O-methyltransferase
LIEQLEENGKMIIPVGETYSVQFLKLITKKDKQLIEDVLLPVRFVPMLGESR